MKLYSKEHEWIDVSGDEAVFGITSYAVEKLGDITFVELPEIEMSYEQNEVVCSIESVKAASDIFMPLSGEILESNEELDDTPELVNKSPEENGWIAKLTLTSPAEKENLMTEDEYKAYIEELD